MRNVRRYKKKKERTSLLGRRGFWRSVAASFLATGVAYALFLSPWLQIEQVEITGTKQVSLEGVRFMIGEELSETFLGVRTGGNLLLFERERVAANLLSSFPQIAEVDFTRSLSGKLAVKVTERGGVGSWCAREACWSIDGTGVAFKELQAPAEPVFRSSEPKEVSLGNDVVEPGLLNSLLEFRAGIPEASITSFSLREASRVTAFTQGGWSIYLDTSQDMSWQLTKLREVLEQKIPEEERGNLEYIDLRFGDRAYIK